MYSKFFTRLFLLIGMIGLFSASVLAQGGGEIVEIGQATTTTTLSPIYTPMNYSYTQQLYTAEEIGASGTITSIAFHWAYNGSKTYGIDVYMKHTERSYFETSGDRISMSATDKVFTGTINPDHDEWITITLDTPFEYDGSNNLAIAVHRTSGSEGFSEFDNNWNVIGTWYYTSTDRYMMLYMGDDQSQYVSLSPAYMAPSNYRPNIQIELASAVATCKAPKNLAASNVSTNSATLTWTAGSNDQTDWDVYLTQSSTDVPNDNTTPTYQVTGCTKALTGLTAQTTYYAYVRSVCGSDDKSRWVSTNFTTKRNAYHVGANSPYETDFESSCDWAFTNGSLTNQWYWGNATNHGGQKAMYISNDNGTSNDYTVNSAAVVYASKLFTFDQGSYTFVFDWKAMGEGGSTPYDYLRVALVPGDVEFTASTSTPSVPSGGFYNNLPSGWIALDGGHQLNQSSSWQTQTAEISVSGTYTMVFVWRDDTSGGDNPPAAIDNISISMLSCSKPTNLTANPNNIGSRTATLTWTAGGSETLWDIYLSTSSTAPNAQTTPTESNIGSTSHTFNSLQPATTYYAWVRSNCGGGDVSSWSDVYCFSTSCEAYTIPQQFGFEDEATMNCFNMESCANSTGRYNQDARTGTYCFRFFYNTNPPQYLIFPELTGTENGVHVEFYYKKGSSGTEKFKVGYSTTTDATSSFTWGNEVTNATTSYQLFEMDCPAGTKYVAIQYTANNQWYLYIDDISLSLPTSNFTKDITAYTENSKDRYYLIASPIGEVNPENVTNMLANNYDLYYFDQSATDGLEWINYRSNANAGGGFNLQPGKGYLYANNENVTLSFTGVPYNGNGQFDLTYDENASLKGWNLIGNPYPTIALLDNMSYYRLNPDGNALNATTENTPVAAMEGVFVQVTEANQKANFVVVTNNGEPSKVAKLNINVTQGRATGSATTLDNAIVRFDNGSTLGKFQLNPNHTKVYIPQGGKDYAIVRSATQGEMPVNFKAEKNGSYTLNVSAENMGMHYLHLIDNMTGADVDLLADPSYSFEAKTTDYASRFRLVFDANENGASTSSAAFAYYNGNNWVISNPSTSSGSEATLQVIDVMGRILRSETLKGNAEINLNQPAGIYMLRLVNGENVKTQKIVVR